MIRAATLDDIPAIAKLGESFHAEAGFGDVFGYSADDCAASLSVLMQSGLFLCFVADERGVVGAIGGLICPVYFNHAHLSGEEMFWYVSPEASQMVGIRLLEALEREAKGRGCQSWQMKSIDKLNGDRMARVYQRRGYRPSEHSFIKRL